MSEQNVLATIDGVQITEADVDEYIAHLPQDRQMFASSPAFKKQCLDQLIAMHCYAKLAEEEKLDETPEFKAIIAKARREILAQFAINQVVSAVEVTDAECKAVYDENPQNFNKPATVSAKHILVKEEDACKSILADIESGKTDFESAAKDHSTCPSSAQGGDLGEFGRGEMVPEFEQAAFDAETGRVVGPVQTQFGYHLIKVENKSEGGVQSFEAVAEQIRANLLQTKQNDAYYAKAEALRKKYMGE